MVDKFFYLWSFRASLQYFLNSKILKFKSGGLRHDCGHPSSVSCCVGCASDGSSHKILGDCGLFARGSTFSSSQVVHYCRHHF